MECNWLLASVRISNASFEKELRQSHSKFFVVFTKALIKREFHTHSVKMMKAKILTLLIKNRFCIRFGSVLPSMKR